MAKTYDPTLGTAKDKARFRLDDTGKAGDMVLEDAEIEFTVTENGEVEGTARLAETLSLYWAKKADIMQDGDTHTHYLARSTRYRQMADRIRSNVSDSFSQNAAVGEITKPDMSTMRTD